MLFYRLNTCSLPQVKYLTLIKAKLSLQIFPTFEVLTKPPHTHPIAPRHLF